MPYDIEKKGNEWVVKNSKTGKIHGTHDSKEKALRQMKLLYGIEKGWKPTK